ncbi:MAG TPA: (d)CMP kinase, partial [Candidatus Omnitrophota bacterium]|nr:(d)CMP kinase [Candidatus Omnitrophota bacterium]
MTAYPGAGIDIVRPAEVPSFLQIDIPSELATLDGLFEAPVSPDPRLILHIQNAHANYGAQEKIKQLLQYLERTYAIRTIFVEGASEDLNPDYLKMFPDRERNLKLADFLAKQGELTGAELFILEENEKRDGGGRMEEGVKTGSSPSAIRHPISRVTPKAHGIENAALYRQNYEALKKVFGNEATVNRYLLGFEARLDGLASKVFGADLRKLLGEWKKFEKGNREFMPYIRALATEAKRILGSDLESLLSQIEWPQITRILVLQTMEKDLNVEKGLAEKGELIRFLKEKKASPRLIAAIENFQDQRMNVPRGETGQNAGPIQPRDLMEQLVNEAGPKGFYFYNYPNFSLYAGYIILKSELDPKGLFDEIRLLFTRIMDKLAVSERQKTLLGLYRDEELVRKLLNLELTRKNWQDVLSRGTLLSMDSLVTRLKDIGTAVATESNLPLTNFETKKVNPKFRSEVMDVQAAAYDFYEAARKREEVFYEKIDSVMRGGALTKAVLITGGFHTDGITELLREHEISYGILTPRLSEKGDEHLYRAVMLQNTDRPFSISYLEQSVKEGPVVNQPNPAGALGTLVNAIAATDRKEIRQAVEIFNASTSAQLNNLRLERRSEDSRGRPTYQVVSRTGERMTSDRPGGGIDQPSNVLISQDVLTDVLADAARGATPVIATPAVTTAVGRIERLVTPASPEAVSPSAASDVVRQALINEAQTAGVTPAQLAAAVVSVMPAVSTSGTDLGPVDVSPQATSTSGVSAEPAFLREENGLPEGIEVPIVMIPLKRFVVTLDGPPAAGKTTTSRMVVRRLHEQGIPMAYVDSGFVYRAMAASLMKTFGDVSTISAVLNDSGRLTAFLKEANIRLQLDEWADPDESMRVFMGDSQAPVPLEALRNEGLNPVLKLLRRREVHQYVFQRIRNAGEDKNLMAVGRNMGTLVFPDATGPKIYLTVSQEERAKRRKVGLEAIQRRDASNLEDPVAPLIIPRGAVEIDTTGGYDGVLEKSRDATVEKIFGLMSSAASAAATETAGSSRQEARAENRATPARSENHETPPAASPVSGRAPAADEAGRTEARQNDDGQARAKDGDDLERRVAAMTDMRGKLELLIRHLFIGDKYFRDFLPGEIAFLKEAKKFYKVDPGQLNAAYRAADILFDLIQNHPDEAESAKSLMLQIAAHMGGGQEGNVKQLLEEFVFNEGRRFMSVDELENIARYHAMYNVPNYSMFILVGDPGEITDEIRISQILAGIPQYGAEVLLIFRYPQYRTGLGGGGGAALPDEGLVLLPEGYPSEKTVYKTRIQGVGRMGAEFIDVPATRAVVRARLAAGKISMRFDLAHQKAIADRTEKALDAIEAWQNESKPKDAPAAAMAPAQDRAERRTAGEEETVGPDFDPVVQNYWLENNLGDDAARRAAAKFYYEDGRDKVMQKNGVTAAMFSVFMKVMNFRGPDAAVKTFTAIDVLRSFRISYPGMRVSVMIEILSRNHFVFEKLGNIPGAMPESVWQEIQGIFAREGFKAGVLPSVRPEAAASAEKWDGSSVEVHGLIPEPAAPADATLTQASPSENWDNSSVEEILQQILRSPDPATVINAGESFYQRLDRGGVAVKSGPHTFLIWRQPRSAFVDGSGELEAGKVYMTRMRSNGQHSKIRKIEPDVKMKVGINGQEIGYGDLKGFYPTGGFSFTVQSRERENRPPRIEVDGVFGDQRVEFNGLILEPAASAAATPMQESTPENRDGSPVEVNGLISEPAAPADATLTQASPSENWDNSSVEEILQQILRSPDPATVINAGESFYQRLDRGGVAVKSGPHTFLIWRQPRVDSFRKLEAGKVYMARMKSDGQPSRIREIKPDVEMKVGINGAEVVYGDHDDTFNPTSGFSFTVQSPPRQGRPSRIVVGGVVEGQPVKVQGLIPAAQDRAERRSAIPASPTSDTGSPKLVGASAAKPRSKLDQAFDTFFAAAGAFDPILSQTVAAGDPRTLGKTVRIYPNTLEMSGNELQGVTVKSGSTLFRILYTGGIYGTVYYRMSTLDVAGNEVIDPKIHSAERQEGSDALIVRDLSQAVGLPDPRMAPTVVSVKTGGDQEGRTYFEIKDRSPKGVELQWSRRLGTDLEEVKEKVKVQAEALTGKHDQLQAGFHYFGGPAAENPGAEAETVTESPAAPPAVSAINLEGINPFLLGRKSLKDEGSAEENLPNNGWDDQEVIGSQTAQTAPTAVTAGRMEKRADAYSGMRGKEIAGYAVVLSFFNPVLFVVFYWNLLMAVGDRVSPATGITLLLAPLAVVAVGALVAGVAFLPILFKESLAAFSGEKTSLAGYQQMAEKKFSNLQSDVKGDALLAGEWATGRYRVQVEDDSGAAYYDVKQRKVDLAGREIRPLKISSFYMQMTSVFRYTLIRRTLGYHYQDLADRMETAIGPSPLLTSLFYPVWLIYSTFETLRCMRFYLHPVTLGYVGIVGVLSVFIGLFVIPATVVYEMATRGIGKTSRDLSHIVQYVLKGRTVPEGERTRHAGALLPRNPVLYNLVMATLWSVVGILTVNFIYAALGVGSAVLFPVAGRAVVAGMAWLFGYVMSKGRLMEQMKDHEFRKGRLESPSYAAPDTKSARQSAPARGERAEKRGGERLLGRAMLPAMVASLSLFAMVANAAEESFFGKIFSVGKDVSVGVVGRQGEDRGDM